MGPLVSIIIPTYGRPAFLSEAIDSVLTQSVTDLECVVVDDASPTPLELPRDARIRAVRRTTNGGAAAARNTGIEASTGQYVTFLDDDDVITPDRLEIGLRAVERAAIGLCGLASLGDPYTGPSRSFEGVVVDTIVDGLVPNVGQALVRRAELERFDERFRACEDIDWWIRMAARGGVAHEPQVGYLYRHHSGRRHRNELTARLGYRRELMHKHQSYFASHPRAEAFQLRRIGAAARELGRTGEARSALIKSMRLAPSLRTARQLLAAFVPSAARPTQLEDVGWH